MNQVSTNGSIVFPNREALTFDVPGTVGDVLVEEGQQVEEGQELARLDQSIVVSLESSVAKARLTLRDAEEALQQAKDPHTALEVARAEAKVADARLSLQEAQDDLATLIQPPQEEVADAQSLIDSEATVLAGAEGDLSLARKDWDAKIETAQDSINAAFEGYQTVFQKWLGIDPPEVKQDGDPDTLLNAWGADLGSLFNTAARFQGLSLGLVSQGPPPDDPDTPWSEVVVYLWANFHPGKIVPTCEDGNIDPRTLCVRQEMDDAWDTLQSTVDQLDTAETQAAKAIGNAEQAVIRAQASLDDAELELTELLGGPDPLEAEAQRMQVVVNQADLGQAEEDLAELLGRLSTSWRSASERPRLPRLSWPWTQPSSSWRA